MSVDFILRFMALPEWYERNAFEKFMVQCKSQVEINLSYVDVKDGKAHVHFKFDWYDNSNINLFECLNNLYTNGLKVDMHPQGNAVGIDVIYVCDVARWVERYPADKDYLDKLSEAVAEVESEANDGDDGNDVLL